MRRDKAFLPFGNSTMAAHVAARVAEAAGSATLVGDPNTYAQLGYPVIPDTAAGAGPLAGVTAALAASAAEWNLIVACDMPMVTSGFLARLLDEAAASGADCLMPRGPSGRTEPLCAVYRRRALAVLARSLEQGVRKLATAASGLRTEIRDVPEANYFANCNTPEAMG